MICGIKRKYKKVIINAHHIFPFAIFKDRRFDINNGITLCEECHRVTYKNELKWIPLLSSINRVRNFKNRRT